VAALAVTPDGSAVACVAQPGGEPGLTVWEADTGKPRWTAAGTFAAAAFSPDGARLAVAGRESGNPVRLWDARTGKPLGLLGRHDDPVRSVAYFPDGRLAAGAGTSLTVWDPPARRRLPESTEVPRGIDRVAVTPDGRFAVMTTPEVFVRRLPADDRPDLPNIPIPKTLSGFALSPDGRLLATADGGHTVRVWELLSGLEAAAIDRGEPVAGVAFAPAGGVLALATGRGTVLFDLPRSAVRLTLPAGNSPDTIVAFSGDGRRLVTAGNRDSTATVWDVADRQSPPARTGAPLDPADLDRCWTALADSDPKVGYAAAWRLAAAPDAAVPFLSGMLDRPLPEPARIARLIADLDHARYPTREQATKELEAIGEQAVGALREARKGKVSAEQAERINNLVAKFAGPKPSPDRLRSARAVAALELIGGPRARAVLDAVAKGPPGAPRTEEAKAALGRWR
jgi:hypothetical protein